MKIKDYAMIGAVALPEAVLVLLSKIYSSRENTIQWVGLGILVFYFIFDKLVLIDYSAESAKKKAPAIPVKLEDNKLLQDIYYLEHFITRQMSEGIQLNAILAMIRQAGYDEDTVSLTIEKLKAKGVLVDRSQAAQPAMDMEAEIVPAAPAAPAVNKGGRPKKQ